MDIIAKARAFRALLNQIINFIPEEQENNFLEVFPTWKVNYNYIIGDKVKYNNTLYKCVQAHTSQISWTPDITPALWSHTSVDEWPEWVQPAGAQDAYNIGDKVTFNNSHYISLINGNVWSPETYPAGWELQ